MKGKRQSRAGLVFDVLFELILCFAVLLVAMLLSRGDVIGGPYELNVPILVVSLGLIAFFLIFVSIRSAKNMDESIDELRMETKGGYVSDGDDR